MASEALWFFAVNRSVQGPGPTTKLGAAVIRKGLLELGPRIHHKGTVLRDGFANWSALQQQELDCLRAGYELDLAIGSNSQAGFSGVLLAGNCQGGSLEEIQNARRVGSECCWQSPLGASLHSNRPDRHI